MPDITSLTALEVMRGTSLTIWALICIGTVKAFVRHMRGIIEAEGEWWAFVFMVGMVFASWGVRNVVVPAHPIGASYSATCAAQALTVLLGLSVLRKRVRRLGWGL